MISKTTDLVPNKANFFLKTSAAIIFLALTLSSCSSNTKFLLSGDKPPKGYKRHHAYISPQNNGVRDAFKIDRVKPSGYSYREQVCFLDPDQAQ